MSLIHSNLILTGMPGAGKSTVGVILAKRAAYAFIDTDVLIQTLYNRSLQEIVDKDGYAALLKIEEATLLGLNVERHVIATGGSAVYSDQAMSHLKAIGRIVLLDVDLPTLAGRGVDFDSRGVVKRPGQSLSSLYSERQILYRKYADITIACKGLTQEKICARILALEKDHQGISKLARRR